VSVICMFHVPAPWRLRRVGRARRDTQIIFTLTAGVTSESVSESRSPPALSPPWGRELAEGRKRVATNCMPAPRV
jgi:hypothetical protein